MILLAIIQMVVGTYQSVQNDHMSRRISLSVDPRVMSGELSKRDQMSTRISLSVDSRVMSGELSKHDHMSTRISLSVDTRVMSGELSKRDQMWVTDDDLQATYNVSIIKRKF